ncbi:hypothetical protein NCDO763_2218 [Lactococcus cremoris]|nr:hypothetical protein V4_0970 [Lactococcus cremoris]KZK38485.1 hypothetical protein N41_1396 [Lactococcus cremoris]KZK49366.1 hypothetical protein NCDO763_2218 [Lactococcus cremoris]
MSKRLNNEIKITDQAVSNFLLKKKLSVKFIQKLVIYKRKRYNYCE